MQHLLWIPSERPSASRRRLAAVLVAVLLAFPGAARADLRGRWIGQDGRDFVGPNSAEAPSGVQDIHIRLDGLPPAREVAHAVVRGLGGDEWQYQGPNGPWRAHLVRRARSTNADLYLEPTRAETGRGFTVTVRFDDGSSTECIVEGGRADPNLRMPSARLRARWLGQDGRDRAGPGPSVGPDGVQDVGLHLEGLSPNVEVEAVVVRAKDGVRWCSGVNPDALPNAELVRQGDRTRAELLFNPDRDRRGETLRVGVRYANGKTDAAEVVAGPSDPSLRVEAPTLRSPLAHRVTARWLGQGDDPDAGPGSVRVALSGLPPGAIVAAALSDPVGGAWIFKTRDDVPLDAATYPQPLAFRRGDDPSSAEIAFAPIRDESGATLTLRILYEGGFFALVPIPGGPADPSLRNGPGPDDSSVVAKPDDDLQALAARFGRVRLSAGTYRLDRPLVLDRPIAILGDPGAVLRFHQPDDAPPWTAAIKVHAGRTTLQGVSVRFEGPVRWASDVSYGPAVIGTTDNLDQERGTRKSGLVFRELDLESPPAQGEGWEEATRLLRLVTAENGRIERCRLRGGMVEFSGGPWRITDNEYLGTPPRTFNNAVFAGHGTHDLILQGNTTKSVGDSGKTWRFLVLTNSGANDLVAENRVEDIGPRDDDVIPQANAPEIILTESYRLRFEGRPLALSADRRIMAIPEPQGEPAEPGDALAILEGPHAGEFRRVSQRISRTTYLLDEPLPPGEFAVSIASGFVGERFEGNRIDARGGSVAAGFVLVGNHFGTKVVDNHVLGCGEAFRLTAAPTESPGPWGWSHAPFLGVTIERNTIEDSLRGLTLAVELGPPVKSSRGRAYLSASSRGNTVRWPPAFLKARRKDGPPPAFTIGDPRAVEPASLMLRTEDDAADPRGAMVVHAATVNGRAVRDRQFTLSPREIGGTSRKAARAAGSEGQVRWIGSPRSSLAARAALREISDPHVPSLRATSGPSILLSQRDPQRSHTMRTVALAALALLVAAPAPADEPAFSAEAIFPPENKHNHASCLVELPNGDLLVAWYRGSGERQADDVEVLGSRLKPGETAWEPRFSMADTPGYPDCNPALFAAPDGSVWLWWPTILDHRWEGALLKYRVARDPGTTGAPRWDWQGVLHVTPEGFAEAAAEALKSLEGAALRIDATAFDEIRRRSKDPLYQRLGWMPRVHPTVLPSGRWLLPLYTDTFSCSIIAISDDKGESWTFSNPIIGFGNIQPSLVRKDDGTLVAFMRENGPRRHVRLSTSTDDGKTWGPVTSSELPNPGAGIEAVRLASGNWAIAYNDTTSGRHSLAISLSDDEGQTWKWTRHVEKTRPGDQFHYPSIMRAKDGSIHLSYTRRTTEGSTIQHARFNEAWVQKGD